MAPTGRNAQRGGWQHQANRLVLTHTAGATTAMAAAEQALHQAASNPVSCHFRTGGTEFQHRLEASIIELAPEPDPPRTKLVDLEQQVARTAAAAWLLNGRRETLAARAARSASADKRATELENELGLVRQQLVIEENENHSLQLSLDLTIGENSRLTSRLAEGERQLQKLAQLHSKLIDDMNTLLNTCKRRDAALARAEERLSLLAELFVQLEAANLPNTRDTVEELNSKLQRELDNDKWLLAEANTVFKKTA
jgi:chromosome segregation ATPase